MREKPTLSRSSCLNSGRALELLQQAEEIKLHPMINNTPARYRVDDDQTCGD